MFQFFKTFSIDLQAEMSVHLSAHWPVCKTPQMAKSHLSKLPQLKIYTEFDIYTEQLLLILFALCIFVYDEVWGS